MVRLTDRLDMTIVVDWDVKPQIKQNKTLNCQTFFEMTPSFRGTSRRKNMVCASLREISRSFLRESSRLRTFVRGVNAKKRVFFSWADLYMYKIFKIFV